MKAITSRIWCVIFTLMVAGTVSTHKAVAQGQAPVALSVDRFMLGGLHNTRKFDSVSVTQKLPSPGKALTLSMASTLIPIAAGAAIWASQKDEYVTEHETDPWPHTYGYYKDPNRTLPFVLITAGVIIGPSVGYFYSDCGGRGAKGLAIRGIVATATAATATAVAYSVQGDGWMDFSGLIAGLVIGGVGSVVVATDAVVDLCKVEKNVRARNEQRSRTTIGLVPGYSPDSGTPTLSLQVKF